MIREEVGLDFLGEIPACPLLILFPDKLWGISPPMQNPSNPEWICFGPEYPVVEEFSDMRESPGQAPLRIEEIKINLNSLRVPGCVCMNYYLSGNIEEGLPPTMMSGGEVIRWIKVMIGDGIPTGKLPKLLKDFALAFKQKGMREEYPV
jgi:hypothetical protein